MNREVDKYIAKQPSPQKDMCKELRKIILQTFPEIKEEMKNGVPWYGKYYIVGLKDSVNLGFSVLGLSEKDKSNFTGAGKLMRHMKFKTLGEIQKKEVVELLKLVDQKASCEGL